MRIEGTITRVAKFGRMLAALVGNSRVFIEHEVFEDLGQLQIGTEIEVECFEGDKGRMIAIAVTVLRQPKPEHEEGFQVFNGVHIFKPSKEEVAQQGEKQRNWRYRRST